MKALAVTGKAEAGMERIEQLMTQIRGPDSASSFSRFLARPWFTRRWVYQEAARGHDVSVHCGQSEILWVWFSEGMDVLKMATDNWLRLPKESMNAIDTVCTIQAGRKPILDLLWNFHAAQCSDPKDMSSLLAPWQIKILVGRHGFQAGI